MKSDGSAKLAEITKRHTAAAVARTVNASEAAVRAWAKGDRRPSGAARAALHSAYAIDPGSWTTPAGDRRARARTPRAATTLAPEAPAPPSTHPEPSATTNAPPRGAQRNGSSVRPPRPAPVHASHGKPDAQELAVRLVNRIEAELARAQDNPDYSPRERATLATAGTSALRLYSRLCGSLEVTQATIVRSAAWGRILRAFERTFAAHPEAERALRAFADELKEIGA